MSKITMYDMGFGDAHILEREGYGDILLIDCGSSNSDKANVSSNTIPLITKKINKYDTSLLLTHFHSDHYNQLKHLPNNCFKNIYLRNIYASKTTIYRSIYELMFFQKFSKRWKNALYTILAIPNLKKQLKKRGKFVFVRKESKFILNDEEYDVYRPIDYETNIKLINFKEVKANMFVNDLYSKITILGNIVIEHCVETDLGTMELYEEEIRDALNSTFIEVEDEIKRLASSFNLELSNESKNKLSGFIKSSDEHKYNIIFGLRSNNKHNNGFNNSLVGHREADNSLIKFITNIDFKESNKLRILMCGDAYPRDVEDVIMEEEIALIDVMKAPHHGTPRYFPKLDNVIVNNVLISYSRSKNVFRKSANSNSDYSIDSRYSNSPYKKSFEPLKDSSY